MRKKWDLVAILNNGFFEGNLYIGGLLLVHLLTKVNQIQARLFTHCLTIKGNEI